MKKLFKATLHTEKKGITLGLAPIQAETYNQAFNIALGKAMANEYLQKLFPVEEDWDVTITIEVVTD